MTIADDPAWLKAIAGAVDKAFNDGARGDLTLYPLILTALAPLHAAAVAEAVAKAVTAERERHAHEPPCALGVAANEPCKPEGKNLRRCTICGWIVDLKYEAIAPTQRLPGPGQPSKAIRSRTTEPGA